jgi:hypothetical protein
MAPSNARYPPTRISEQIHALRVDAEDLTRVLNHAAEDASGGILEFGVAGQLRSQQDGFLFLGEMLPGLDHVRGAIARAVEEHDGR